MRIPAFLIIAPALLSSGAMAREPARPITDREPRALDVAKTPATDLNLSRTEIPALLVEAQKRPYSLLNLDTCARLVGAVNELDGVLGPDLDLPQSDKSRFSEGRIAQWMVGKFIPFRSLIREVSGANRQQREIGAAIQAGLARRGFLKGVGVSRNCAYPASPATETIKARHNVKIEEEGAMATSASKRNGGDDDAQGAPTQLSNPAGQTAPLFTSHPVVQSTK